MLGKMCIVIICFLVYSVINFEINLSFFNKPFSYMTVESQHKNLNNLGTKKNF